MRRLIRWIVPCAALGLSACSTLPRPVGPDLQGSERQKAAVPNRWIGVTKLWRQRCPVPGAAGWTVRPLFPLQNLEPALQAPARRAKLHRFCVYEYEGDEPYPMDLELPPEVSARLRSAEHDRIALAGAASLDEITREPFYQHFLGQAQIPEHLPLTGSPRVRLAFLDTQPDGERIPAADPRSPHGYTLLHIADRLSGPLACRDDKSSCAIELASRLALPVVRFNPATGLEEERDTARGGYRGSLDDLTSALWAEINHRPEHRLVLNLSVGWDGEKLGGWETELSDMTPAVQGVYRALRFAADRDILVIAAAGNELEGQNPTDQPPLLPGGWEMRQLPKEDGFEKRPFIYAVSGVDGAGHPLVNTRAQGEAPRVAYADHVKVPDLRKPGLYTATLTGTSVASAMVSTIASIVWSHRPELTPAQVMDTLSASGEVMETPLDAAGERRPRRPDISAPSEPATDVRRITLCRALTLACSAGDHCPAPACDRPDALPQPDWNAFEAPRVDSILTRFPSRSHRDVRDGPWIATQPGVDPCPNCAVTGPPDRAAATPTEKAVVAHLATRSYGEQPALAASYTDDLYELYAEVLRRAAVKAALSK